MASKDKRYPEGLRTREQRRARVDALLREDSERTNEWIARQGCVSRPCVIDRRRRLEATGDITPRVYAPQARTPTVTVGTADLAPRRERFEAWARARWGFIDDERAGMIAQLGAVVDQVWGDWIESKGLIRSAKRGDVWPAVATWDRLHTRLWATIKELDAEGRERHGTTGETLESYVAGLAEENGSGE